MLFTRIKAAVVDTLFLVIMIFIIDSLFSNVEFASSTPKIIILCFVFFLYDPISTSFFGGTLGHFLLGIGVKKESNNSENIPLHKAVVRYFFKVLLGWASLLTLGLTSRSKAIHDMIVGSVVIYRE